MNNNGTTTMPGADAVAEASLASVVERQVAFERKLDTLIELLGVKSRAKESQPHS